jgi:hypothetical protein
MDVIRLVVRTELARLAIEISRRQARKQRYAATQDSADQLAGKVREPDAPAELEKLEVAFGRNVDSRIALRALLARKPLAQVDLVRTEPRRIEDREVVRVDAHAVSATQRVAAKENGVRPAVIEPSRAPDDCGQRLVVPPVRVDRVQARRTARRLVGLRQRRHGKLEEARTPRRAIVAATRPSGHDVARRGVG